MRDAVDGRERHLEQYNFDLFAFQRRGLLLLLAWGLASIAAGLRPTKGGRELGRHLVGWGLFDALLAAGGLAISGVLARRTQPGRADGAEYRRQVAATQLILRVSVVLDLLLLLAGLATLTFAGRSHRQAGHAMILQSCFLIPFDSIHALLLEQAANQPPAWLPAAPGRQASRYPADLSPNQPGASHTNSG